MSLFLTISLCSKLVTAGFWAGKTFWMEIDLFEYLYGVMQECQKLRPYALPVYLYLIKESKYSHIYDKSSQIRILGFYCRKV